MMIIWYGKEILFIMKRNMLLVSLIFLLSTYFTMNVCGITTDSEVKLDQKEYTGLGDRIKVQIKAPSLNLHTYSAEQLEIRVTTSEDPIGFPVIVQETKEDSGVFEVYLKFNLNESSAKQKSIKVKTGSKIYIKYKDIIKETTWKPDDAVLKFDKAAYNGYGVQPLITLDDNDLNLLYNAVEEINLIVRSSSDPAGISVKLVEKSADSGVFTGSFGMDLTKSDDVNNKLKIAYNGTMTISCNDVINTTGKAVIRTGSSTWKTCTGTVKFGKSALTGLQSTAAVSVTDQDLNLRTSYVDTTRVKIASDTDPNGFTLTLYETGTSTGVFSNSIKFSTSATDGSKGIIKIRPTDKIIAEYRDALNAENVPGMVTAAAAFQFSEAAIATSAKDDTGTGNTIDITITDPDANNPAWKDTIIANVGAGNSTSDLTLHLTETGNNTGKFKTTLYFTNDDSNGRMLYMSGLNKVNIKYVDKTVPQGGSKDIIKTVAWDYKSSIMSLDKAAYTGYNTSAKITLNNMDLNNESEEVEYIEAEVLTGNDKNMEMELKETGKNTGKFTGTLYFGRSTDEDENKIKMTGTDSITITYTNENDEFDVIECYADWTPQDAVLTLSKQEYCGKDAPVLITLTDFDIADNRSAKDNLRVKAKVTGSTRETSVTLTETSSNTGKFTGTLYINGSSPSIKLIPGNTFEVYYMDEETTSGAEIERTATASWTGISEAGISLDKTQYTGYNTYMTITVTDPDGNKYPASRESIEVAVKTVGSTTGKKYTLRETGANTGIFTVKLKLIKESSTGSALHVRDTDTITVTFSDKRVSAAAGFTK